MLTHYSTRAATTDLNGQVISTNHYGRDTDSLPMYLYSDTFSSKEGGYNLAEDYYLGRQESQDGNFLFGTYNPYITAQGTAYTPDSAVTDSSLPRPIMGQAESVISKYESLNNSTFLGLFNSEMLLGGVTAEIQPYYERMLVDTAIQELTTDAERAQIDSYYMQSGVSRVAHILDNDAYTNTDFIQWVYALSDSFLSLSETDKAAYALLDRSVQWDMIYVDADQRSAYIQQQTPSTDLLDRAYVSGGVNSYKTNLGLNGGDAPLGKYKVDEAFEKFKAFRAETGRDFESEFDATFKAQTQQMDFSSVADELNVVARLYKGILGRDPDKAGFEYWVKEINGGYSLDQLAEGFVDSSEFRTKAGTEGAAVTFDQTLESLYNVVLDRPSESQGYDYWKNKHDNENYTLGRVATGFTESVEFDGKSDQDVHAWLAATYGPNLVSMDYSSLAFDQAEIDAIKVVGSYDMNTNDGYSGLTL